MKELERDYYKKILKPDIAKVSLAVALLLILPLYPVSANGNLVNYPYARISDSYTTIAPLITVLIENFEWSTTDNWINSTTEELRIYRTNYVANPLSLILYIPFSILIYFLSGFMVEYYRYWHKHKRKPGIKELAD